MTGEKVCGVVAPLLVTLIGVPLEIRNPQIQLNRLAHPQASAVTMVAMIPIVLFCIDSLLENWFDNLTSQLRADFMFQALYNFIADGSGFSICHRPI